MSCKSTIAYSDQMHLYAEGAAEFYLEINRPELQLKIRMDAEEMLALKDLDKKTLNEFVLFAEEE